MLYYKAFLHKLGRAPRSKRRLIYVSITDLSDDEQWPSSPLRSQLTSLYQEDFPNPAVYLNRHKSFPHLKVTIEQEAGKENSEIPFRLHTSLSVSDHSTRQPSVPPNRWLPLQPSVPLFFCEWEAAPLQPICGTRLRQLEAAKKWAHYSAWCPPTELCLWWQRRGPRS